MRRTLFRPLATILVLALLGLGLAAPEVLAQTPPAAESPSTTIDYDAWEVSAIAAENLITGGIASTAFFEARRLELAEWRARFLEAETANAQRVETIQGQLQALGAPPAEGETEPEEIATRRADLAERLSEAQAPRLRATEALSRANGLIAEIDAVLANRQAAELLELDPAPVNPVNWATALSALAELAGRLQHDLRENLADEDVRSSLADNAPGLVGALVLGLILVLRGRIWVSRLGERFLDRDQRRGRASLGYLVSLGQLILPIVGFGMILVAIEISGALTEDAASIVQSFVFIIMACYTALWLGGRLFPASTERTAVFEAVPDIRARARRTILLVGLFMGLVNLAEVVAGLDSVPPSARGVMIWPLHLGLAVMYVRLAQLLRRLRATPDTDEATGFAFRVAGLFGRALRVIAVLGPLLGALGYLNAAEAIMVPTALTLAVLGVILSIQPIIKDLYALTFRSTADAATEALLPVLVNFVLAFGSLPLLAMIWGMRPDRIGELWVRFAEGISLGETRITPGTIVAVVVVFALGMALTRLVQGTLRSTVLPRTRLDTGARNAVTSGIGYVGVALAALIAITTAGIDLTALGFVLGALSVGIGFGLQNVVSNFVSGIILLIERPISEGDWIEVNGNMGIVQAISVRSTRIETFDKTDVIVPNADFISGTVTNWTRGNTIGRAIVTVGVAYGTDTRRVADILMELARAHPDVSSFPEPGVDFLGFGADSLDFRIRVILRDVGKTLSVKTELHHQIAERFAAEGIEIPFAQRDIWLRNPEALPQPNPAPQKDAE